MQRSDRFFLITGCSGGGKSTLLNALNDRGYNIVKEPGRRIIAEERAQAGHAFPWVDAAAFAHRALDIAQTDLKMAQSKQSPVFFDRGLVDAAVALQDATGTPYRTTLGERLQYSRRVFLAPPWSEIFVQDEARRHDFRSATQEYDRLAAALIELGYDICVLPKVPVKDRARFVLEHLTSS